MNKLNEQVVKELLAMKSVGMRVPERAFDIAGKGDLIATLYGAPCVAEIASLIIELVDADNI